MSKIWSAAEDVAAFRAKRQAESAEIDDVARELISSVEPIQDEPPEARPVIFSDTQGSPTETTNWRHLQAVMEARRRDL